MVGKHCMSLWPPQWTAKCHLKGPVAVRQKVNRRLITQPGSSTVQDNSYYNCKCTIQMNSNQFSIVTQQDTQTENQYSAFNPS